MHANFIGTDVAGHSALPNAESGVDVIESSNNVISANVVSANGTLGTVTGTGVRIEGSQPRPAQGNIVRGNLIGTQVDGTSPLRNRWQGVSIQGESFGNAIGGTGLGEGNTIAFNDGDGVRVYNPGSTTNTIRANSIHSNSGKGIRTGFGGNGELAPPTVTAAGGGSASGTTLLGCMTVDVYSDDLDEGRVYQGAAIVSDSSWSYSGGISRPYVTATCTDAAGNTSEFSAPLIHDTDSDGFSDFLEDVIGTNPLDNCGIEAWPLDFNSDTFVTGFDLQQVASVIGQFVPPAPVRRDIAPDPPDGAVTGADLSAVAARIGRACTAT